MKSKTIKLVLRKKIDEWLSSIEDETVRELASKNTIVTGGCIASMLLGERVNDYDIYFANKETAVAVVDYYVKRFNPKNKNGIPCKIWYEEDGDRIKIIIKSAGIASEEGTEKEYQYFEATSDDSSSAYVADVMPGDVEAESDLADLEQPNSDGEDSGKPKYRPVFMSTNAITLSHKVQIVIRFYGNPDEIHENYDFVHCTNWWSSGDSKLELRKEALESLLSKELRYVGSKYPICSLIRLRKFIRRGWTVNAGQILKMVWQISELDLKSHDVLQDQLTGVDVAYFAELITKLREKDPNLVNSAYLTEIIDRMF